MLHLEEERKRKHILTDTKDTKIKVENIIKIDIGKKNLENLTESGNQIDRIIWNKLLATNIYGKK